MSVSTYDTTPGSGSRFSVAHVEASTLWPPFSPLALLKAATDRAAFVS